MPLGGWTSPRPPSEPFGGSPRKQTYFRQYPRNPGARDEIDFSSVKWEEDVEAVEAVRGGARGRRSSASGDSGGERAGAHDACSGAVCRERDPRVSPG